jgi:kynurenine formamidase/SAM-dependent methyltransferase
MRKLVLALVVVAGCASTPPPAPTAAPPKKAEPEPLDLSGVRVIDLSYGFGPSTVYWPTEPDFARKDTFHGKTDGGFFYANGSYAASEHGGTHIDAPVHFAEKGGGVDAIPPSRLVGRAALFDVRNFCAANPNYAVPASDVIRKLLLFAAREDATFREGSIVLILTGWGRYWGDRKAYLGDDRPGMTDGLAFPGISPELAKELVELKVKAVGIDTASIDPGQSKTFEAHRILCAAGIPIFENVANLEALPPESEIVAAPMKIEGGTGAPLRLFALTRTPLGTHRVEAPEDPKGAAELLSRLAPIEAEVAVSGPGVDARISPMWQRDESRLAGLEAALARACFLVRFLTENKSLDSWKAPPWPSHAETHHHDHLEHGSPTERIARYEDPARDAWQKPADVVAALALKEDAVVVDVGVGSGYFAAPLARSLPKGKVIGLDVEPDFVAYVNERARKETLPNLEARLIPEDDPKLEPASVDLVLIVDTYHHLGDRVAYLRKLRAALKPGGRIAVIDFTETTTLGPPREARIAKAKLLEEAGAAGLALAREHAFLPEQYFVELSAR